MVSVGTHRAARRALLCALMLAFASSGARAQGRREQSVQPPQQETAPRRPAGEVRTSPIRVELGAPVAETPVPFEGAPIFAVEVRSGDDYGPRAERVMAQKRADYFAAGTRVVWDVDLLNEDVVRAYRADDPGHPKVFRRGETAAAEPAVPGWTMPVDDLFVE